MADSRCFVQFPHPGGEHPRPSVHLPAFCFTQNLRQGHKLTCDLDEETLHQLWEYLVAQVHDTGLVVGTHAALPQRCDP